MNKLGHFPFIMFFTAIYSGIRFVIAVTSLFLYPFVLATLAWGFLVEFSWKKTKVAATEIFNLIKIVPLSLHVWYWSIECCFMYWCLLKTPDEITPIVKHKIYHNLDIILTTLTILPLSDEAAYHLRSPIEKLKNVGVFGEGRILPYPEFLFKKSPALYQITSAPEGTSLESENTKNESTPRNGEIKSKFEEKSEAGF